MRERDLGFFVLFCLGLGFFSALGCGVFCGFLFGFFSKLKMSLL